MKRIRSLISVPLWALFTFLAFSGQIVGASVHSSSSVAMKIQASSSTSSCHDDDTGSMIDGHQTQPEPAQACCDGECTMSGCHSSSAIVGMLILTSTKLSASLDISYTQSQRVIQYSPLYRPPILG